MAGKYSIPRGTFDILPSESYKWQYLEETFKKIAALYGFKQIVTPIFEKAEIFERSVGDTSDIVQKEMYRFTDKKNRQFVLRPEGTAPVVRSYIENLAAENFTRLYYTGPMFRYDRPQKGRYRQFYQYGIEAIGSADAYIDAQVISMAVQFLNKLGLKQFRLEVNSIGCPECSKVYDNALAEYFTPKLDELCPDCKNRLAKNPKRLLDCKQESCKKIAADAPVILDYLDDSCKVHFELLKTYLDENKIDFIINPCIVRGLDYYTQTAFEVVYTGLGAQNALLGGGRYNGLVKQLGGKNTPGIGFAGGFERLLLALEAEELYCGQQPVPDVYVCGLGTKAVEYARGFANVLRVNGVGAEFDIDKTSMKAQLKAADKSKAKFTLILGDDELDKNIMLLKNMSTSEQKEVTLGAVEEIINICKE